MAASNKRSMGKGPSTAKRRGDAKNAAPPAAGRKKAVNVFHQRLGSLTYHQACQLLGDDGGKLMRQGRRFTEINPEEDVFLGGDLLRIKVHDRGSEAIDGKISNTSVNSGDDAEVPPPESQFGSVVTTMTLQSARAKQIQINCDHCNAFCHHLGAALQYLLEAKSVLGLAAPPDESVPLENLTAGELYSRAMAERQQRAEQEPMTVRGGDSQTPWADYAVTSQNTGRTYRVALRGTEPHQSYCTCPDFRSNGLGTCKHILHVAAKVKRRFGTAAVSEPYKRRGTSLRLHYGTCFDTAGQMADGADEFGLRFNLPYGKHPVVEESVGDLRDQSSTDAIDVMRRIQALEQSGREVRIYPDAEEFIQRQLVREQLTRRCAEIRKDPAEHPLRTELLNAKLLPYQLDGIAFAAAAGRAVSQRHVLHRLQLRAGAAGLRPDRSDRLGLDHFGRGPADQELATQDQRVDPS